MNRNLKSRRLPIFQVPLAADYPENISIYSLEGRRLYTFNPSPDDIKQSSFEDVRQTGECKFVHGKFSALGILYQNRAGEKYIVIAESVFDQVHIKNLTQIMILVFILSIALVSGRWFVFRQASFVSSQCNHEPGGCLVTNRHELTG
jgi:hypothetical protein